MPTTLTKPVDDGHFAPNCKLLLTPREAAETLSVCEKSLWSLTAPRGPLKCCRLGRSVRYSVDALREFIAQQSQA
jgi:hypothetical protein